MKKFKKPNPLIYYPASFIVFLFNKIYLRAKINKSGLKGIKGPAILLCNHLSNYDFLYVGLALLPNRPTYIVSNHFLENKVSRFLLKFLHPISKKMFTADIKTIKNVFKAKESGNIIVMFPEGKLGVNGKTLPLTKGTSDLIKKLDIPVYTFILSGAYKSLPKWGKAGFRRGRIEGNTKYILSSEDIKKMSTLEIEEILTHEMYHNEDETFKDIRYKCKAPALGLDGIIYKCPKCLSEFNLKTNENTIYCTCGFKAYINEKYEIDGPFKTISEWYKFQEDTIDISTPLETECIIQTKDNEGIKVDSGTGIIRMDKSYITFSGTSFGEELNFSEKVENINSFPITVDDHFDMYSNNILYTIVPLPDKRTAIKWVIYLDKVMKEK